MPPLIKTTQPRHRPPVRPLRVYFLLLIKMVRWMCRFCWSNWYHCYSCICITVIISTDASTWTRRWWTPRWQRGWAICSLSLTVNFWSVHQLSKFVNLEKKLSDLYASSSASGRRRANVDIASVAFSWRHAVHNEALTSAKAVRTMRACPWYSNETRRRQSKSVSWTISSGTSLQIWSTARINRHRQHEKYNILNCQYSFRSWGDTGKVETHYIIRHLTKTMT